MLLEKEALLNTVNTVDIVTYLTIAGTNLEVIQPILRTFHKLLLSQTPTDRECREETESLALHEVLRTVIAGIELEEILVVITVSNTTYKSLITLCQIRIVTIVVLVVQKHTGYIMLSKTAGIVDLCLHIQFISCR